MSPVHDFLDIGDVLKHELLQGEIKTIDTATDTCTVSVGGTVYSALVFYHCAADSVLRDNGAIQDGATGFVVGDQVFVMKKIDSSALADVKVVGHVNGARHCAVSGSGYYVFYMDGSTLKAAMCTMTGSAVTVSSVKTALSDLNVTNVDTPSLVGTTTPITWLCKKFSHMVMRNGARVLSDLYYISTSLYFPVDVYYGWKNFCDANPSFPLVTNNLNTEIPYTAQVMSDMQSVNYAVNHANTYASDPAGNDNWQIANGGVFDCEDYALGKAKAMLDLGYPASALHIEGSQIEDPAPGTRAGHAWLVVQTTSGDYALDLNSDSVGLNQALTFGDKAFYTRRRQIGRNWAFISPWSPVTVGVNYQIEWNFSYIFDPLLNILYPLELESWLMRPFSRVYGVFGESGHEPPSINFSNDYIYWHCDGKIYKYQLDENILTLVSSLDDGIDGHEEYVGYVGTDGAIKTSPHKIEDPVAGMVWPYAADVVSPEGYFDWEYWYAPITYNGGYQS